MATTPRLGSTQRMILAYLSGAGGHSTGHLAEQACGGASETAVRHSLARLRDHGLVVNKGDSRMARWYITHRGRAIILDIWAEEDGSQGH